MDPIKIAYDEIWQALVAIIQLAPEGPWRTILAIQVAGLISMIIWVISVRKFWKQERMWSNICAALIDRIDALYPVYNKAAEEYCKMAVDRIGNDKALIALGSGKAGYAAERDYYKYDVLDEERIIALIAQIHFLKTKVAR